MHTALRAGNRWAGFSAVALGRLAWNGGTRPFAMMLCAAVLTLAALPPVQAQSGAARARAPVTVNFVNADVEAVTRAFAAMLDRAIVVDPRVRGTITVYSEQPQTVREAYANYLSALRGLGFAVVESGGLLKVVPEADAKLQTGTVSVGEVPSRGDQVITQIFPLRYENPNNLVAVLRPLISANNTINASPGSNALVITDYAENLQRMAKIIAALDVASGTDVEIVPLQHAVAADLAPLVQRLSEGGGAANMPGMPQGLGGGGGITVIADSRSNSLMLRAPNPARLAALRTTIDRLDRPSNLMGPGGGMWVVHLKNADAVRLATVVRAAFAALTSNNAGGGGGGGAAFNPNLIVGGAAATNAPGGQGQSAAATAPITAAAQPSTGGFIQADPATNSLIITAPEPLYKQVRALIDQLDTRRAQVSIEGLIVEITGDNKADFGVQWLGELASSGNSSLQAAQVLPGATNPSLVTLNSGTGGTFNLASIGSGLNLGILRSVGNALSLSAIVRLLQSQSSTNVLSTPNVLTVDNEEAKIVVGSNVPFLTGQFTNTGTGTTNPFQTIERRDVGLTLRVKPQIGEGGVVRMNIFLESSDVINQAQGTGTTGPTTSKRSVESNAIVDDGAILVIAGLIKESFEESKSKVPLLGDIPLIGGLFRSESRSKTRSNLMIFLRPTVLRSAETANTLSLDRYDLIRAQQKDGQPVPSSVLPINESPVMPPLRAPVDPVAPKPLGISGSQPSQPQPQPQPPQ